jgi:outer membrane protein OmpA-like peptidoglycan-associated protein
MTWCRTSLYPASFRACLIASGLTLASSLGAAAAAAAEGAALLPPTPLILKDGRIANVSIHVVGFPQGQSALASADARLLQALSEEVATDCFLTAQVIGHVGSAEVAGSDTLDAHRLARSRADAIQAALIESGLPAKAIASVWDWQFMVRQSRATLWVFRLTPGEDCEGAPLDGAGPALVAQAEAAAPAAADRPEPSVRPAATGSASVEPPEARVADTVRARPAGPSPALPQVPTVTQALPAASPSTSAPPAADVRSPGSVVALPGRPEPAAEARPERTTEARPTEPRPAEARQTEVRQAEAQRPEARQAEVRQPAARQAGALQAGALQTEVRQAAAPQAQGLQEGAPQVRQAEPEKAAAARPGEVIARAEPAARPAAPEAKAASSAQAERLAIVFPTNSSYFPPGASEQLRRLLRALGQDGAYEIVLQSSISGSQQVVGAESPEEAMRYNKWLAERRLERVREWLDRHAAGRELRFRQDYRAGDESRQVMVEVRPTG